MENARYKNKQAEKNVDEEMLASPVVEKDSQRRQDYSNNDQYNFIHVVLRWNRLMSCCSGMLYQRVNELHRTVAGVKDSADSAEHGMHRHRPFAILLNSHGFFTVDYLTVPLVQRMTGRAGLMPSKVWASSVPVMSAIKRSYRSESSLNWRRASTPLVKVST